MYMDPLYWLLIGAGMLLSLWAQFRVKSAYARYAQVASRSGLTGADVAKRILEANGISGVRVEGIQGRAERELRPGGFGILATRQFVDEMHDSERGNEALRIKRLA